MDKIKVCIIISDSFPVPAVYGGAIETLVESIVKKNEQYGNLQLSIVSPYDMEAETIVSERRYENTRFVWSKKNRILSNIMTFIFKVFRKIFRYEVWFLNPHYVKCYKYLKKGYTDIVLVEGGGYDIVPRFAKYLDIGSLVFHAHHEFIPSKTMLKSYQNVISVSQYISDKYKYNAGNNKINYYVLKNSIEVDRFRHSYTEDFINEKKKKLGFNKDDFIVLYVGRIVEVKGVKQLVKAINMCDDEKIKLIIIGTPNFKSAQTSAYYESVIKEIELSKGKIVHLGYIPNEQLKEYEAISDVQCVPSIWEEPAGLVVLEAMASGLPTIITRSGGMVEFVNDNSTIIINKDNNLEKSLIDAIESLKNDRNKRESMKIAGLENVKKYDIDYYYKSFCNIIREIKKQI